MSPTPADDLTRIAEALVDTTVPDADIDALVDDLQALHRGAALDFALSVARLTIDRIYAGDLDAWREQGPKNGSFRKLAAKLDPLQIPGLSSTSLARAVAVLEVDARVGVSGRPQLTLRHVHAVAGLPAADQERLLGEAEARDLTVTQLRDLADEVRPPARTGRKRIPGFVKTVNRWKRELADEAETFAGIEDVTELDAAERAELGDVVAAMRARCDALMKQLRTRRTR